MLTCVYDASYIHTMNGTVTEVRSQQRGRRAVAPPPELRLAGWGSTRSAQAPLPDDWRVELRGG